MADWESRSSKTTPADRRRDEHRRSQAAKLGEGAFRDDFRDLRPDPRTGQLREMAEGPYAGPTLSALQQARQHPLVQLANMFSIYGDMMTGRHDYTPYLPFPGMATADPNIGSNYPAHKLFGRFVY